MRLGLVAAASLVLLHAARPPDAILLPEPAQDFWPVPVLWLPTADLTLVEATVMEGWETKPTVAVAMSESWFLHRAESENADGTRDIGIGQASAPTRSRIRVLYVRGVSDFGLADDEHFDPWKATRALVYWFSLLLGEASGDLDLATRAYNVGMDSARAGGGSGYLEGVRRRERDYVRGPSPSPSWRWLRARSPSPCPPDEEELGDAPRREPPSAKRP